MDWLSTAWTYISGFFGMVNPWIPVLGTAIGALASYFVKKYIDKKQAEAQANTDMQTAMDEHSGDGSKSVADSDSVDDQMAKLDQQLNEMDQAKVKAEPPPKGASPNGQKGN